MQRRSHANADPTLTADHAAAPVHISEPGVCCGCGLGTAYACPSCRKVHFCSTGCLERARGMHDCGNDFCIRSGNIPHQRLADCWINAHLKLGDRFALPDRHGQPPGRALQPSESYGVKKLSVSPLEARELAHLVTTSRDEMGMLKIGDISYPGYHGYHAIPGPLNNEEQARVTSQLARKGTGRGFDEKRGLQYALNHWGPLKKLVDEVCKHLGGC